MRCSLCGFSLAFTGAVSLLAVEETTLSQLSRPGTMAEADCKRIPVSRAFLHANSPTTLRAGYYLGCEQKEEWETLDRHE